ncbi:MAG: LLM class F420-dependent oxidoreductase [Dehalococcoidia bacterium]|nr:LLM class F420-dependent oxidoreductase [Dehalococcoidia bacterium]MSQ17490.1 LLM class F420-dependent oxidoreductase [Dehalococcoidia bacterium]
MKIGVSIPRLPDADGLRRFARKAEELGFESVLSGDHIVLPTEGTTQYPYTADGSFQRPSNEPFLETMTVLGFLAACTSTVKLGSTVIIVPYRNPVVQAKMFASLDVLTGGRMICGVGVGWLEKEFDTLNVPYAQRGAMTDEYLEVFKVLWTQDDPVYHGQFCHIEGIQFSPKPVQKPHIPIWVGGHTNAALRRTAKYGACWHTTRQTPDFVAGNLPYLNRQLDRVGRDPAGVSISLKRSLHFTDIGFTERASIRSGGAVIGTTQEVLDDVYYCRELGIDQLTYDFRVEGVDSCIRVMEHLADRVLPVAERLG